MKKEGLYLSQIQTDVSFFAFMTAVVVFFNGVLLSQFDAFDIFIKVPISFLIISTFGFLYPALILANASQEVIERKVAKFKKHILYGYVISEYLGVYLLILSVPLIINMITTDSYLRIVTLIASLGGLALYQFLHFSNVEIHFPRGYKIISAIAILFGLALFLSQIYKLYFVQVSIAFLIFILAVTYFAAKKNS